MILTLLFVILLLWLFGVIAIGNAVFHLLLVIAAVLFILEVLGRRAAGPPY